MLQNGAKPQLSITVHEILVQCWVVRHMGAALPLNMAADVSALKGAGFCGIFR